MKELDVDGGWKLRDWEPFAVVCAFASTDLGEVPCADGLYDGCHCCDSEMCEGGEQL